MPIPNIDERKSYARDALAMQSFSTARRQIEIYIKIDPVSRFEECAAFTMSIISFYFRPFKGYPPFKLDKDIVPARFSGLHKKLELMRDKVFAHRDVDVPSKEWGNPNQIGFILRQGSLSPLAYVGLMEKDQAVNLHALIQELEQVLSKRVREFYNKFVPPTLGDGCYILKLTASDDVWFEQDRDH